MWLSSLLQRASSPLALGVKAWSRNGALPWVQGMRVRPPGPVVGASSGSAVASSTMSWQEILLRRLTGRFYGLPRSSSTAKAEAMLWAGNQYVYYGIGRNSPEFGDYVAVFAAIEDGTISGAVAPFDTGGVALGHISLSNPSVDAPADVVHRHAIPLQSHQAALRAWITDSFHPSSDYLSEDRAVTPEKPFAPEISMSRRADPRRWAWEGRLRAVMTDQKHLRARQVYFREDYLGRYRRWLTSHENPLGPEESLKHARLLGRVAKSVPDPYGSMTSDLRKRNFNE